MKSKGWVIGIDASNMFSGGQSGYLVKLFNFIKPDKFNIRKIIVWAPDYLLDRFPDVEWLQKVAPPLLNKSLVYRKYWQNAHLDKLVKEECDVLYSPGGIYVGDFRPFVSASLNILPFEEVERKRYDLFSWMRLKMILLLRSKRKTFKKADGMIFLSQYAKKHITENYVQVRDSKIINFGASTAFKNDIKPQKNIKEYSNENPYRILYISMFSAYKHQWILAEAIVGLRKKGYPLELNLCGQLNFKRSIDKLEKIIADNDPEQKIIKFHGYVSYEKILSLVKETDGLAFSSTCENMPTTLIEYMISGRPIACSNFNPMPEFLEDAGFYYDPTSVEDTMRGLEEMLLNPEKRKANAIKAMEYAGKYSWQKCIDETMGYITGIAEEKSKKK